MRHRIRSWFGSRAQASLGAKGRDQADGQGPGDRDQGCPRGGGEGAPGPAAAASAVLLSPLIQPGTVSTVPYNHYSLLRSIKDIFGLPHLGNAATARVRSFGPDVFG
jgi:hypothetical protein